MASFEHVSAPLVAVIDDDDAIQIVIEEVLHDEGYRTVLWSHPEDPVEFIIRTQPDVVLLDLRLRWNITPWVVMEALDDGAGGLRIPLIICTADAAFVREHGDALRERSCSIVLKPFDIDDLLREIAECLAPSVRL